MNIRDHGPFFPWTAVCHSTADTGSYGRRKGASATELDFLDANSRNASLPESVGQRRVSIIWNFLFFGSCGGDNILAVFFIFGAWSIWTGLFRFQCTWIWHNFVTSFYGKGCSYYVCITFDFVKSEICIIMRKIEVSALANSLTAKQQKIKSIAFRFLQSAGDCHSSAAFSIPSHGALRLVGK